MKLGLPGESLRSPARAAPPLTDIDTRRPNGAGIPCKGNVSTDLGLSLV